MTQWMPQRSELRSALERVAKNDAEARVRERASGAVRRQD